MPSSYTYILGEREDMTLKQFALLCARNFGALIDMREKPLDTPIPEKIEPSPNYKKEYEKAVKQYEDFIKMPDKLGYLETYYNEMVERLQKEYAESSAKKSILRDRYNKMLIKVLRWTAPTNEHEKLRNFMIQQLHDSIEFDCSEYLPNIPPKEEWCDIELHKSMLQKEADFYKKRYEKEIERVKSINQWLKDLRDSFDETIEESKI